MGSQLAAPRRPGTRWASAPTRLHGREAEVRVVERSLRALARGRGGVVLVEGGPGAGKTSLLDEACARAAEEQVRVVRGRVDPAARTTPMGPLLGALLGGEPPVLDAAVLREISGLPDPGFWILQEVQERLARTALEAPLAVVLDDVHWADDATQLALRTLPERLGEHPILWLL